MRNMKSMMLTFLCAVIILGIGYLGIVELGKQILQSESVPERAEHQNAGSNIFYGKIEDNIEIFPWNYYPEDGEKAEEDVIPFFLEDSAFVEQYFPEEIVVQDAATDAKAGEEADVQKEEISDWDMQCFTASDFYCLYNGVKTLAFRRNL